MLGKKVWARLLGVEKTVIESVVYDEQTDAVVASVRPRRGRACAAGSAAGAAVGTTRGRADGAGAPSISGN